MKKFVFRLETVLDLRKRKEEEVQQKLSKILDMERIVREELDSIRQKQFSYRQKIEKLKSNIGKINDLLTYQCYVDSLQNQIEELEKRLYEIGQLVMQVRQELAEAAKERKIIEKMKEKDLEEYMFMVRNKEISQLDEIGVIREARKMIAKDAEKQTNS